MEQWQQATRRKSRSRIGPVNIASTLAQTMQAPPSTTPCVMLAAPASHEPSVATRSGQHQHRKHVTGNRGTIPQGRLPINTATVNSPITSQATGSARAAMACR